jgi:hypothetical protein
VSQRRVDHNRAIARITITDTGLLERQALADEGFIEYFVNLIAAFPAREWSEDSFARGLRYPWYRPERSYLLRDGEAVLLHELPAAEREEILGLHTGSESGRAALLAFGSNAAPKNLSIKLGHHSEPEDRDVLVLAGELHDLDVVASASVAIYGAMPATLAPSPGTSVNAAVLFVSATQLTTLTWGEMPYRVGRLRSAPFTVEDGFDGLEVRSPLAFVSRWGAFAPEGSPAPLAAIPARDRRSRAWTQRELLDRAAEIVLGEDGGGAEELTRAVYADPAAVASRALPILRGYSQPFEYPDWVPIAPDGTV